MTVKTNAITAKQKQYLMKQWSNTMIKIDRWQEKYIDNKDGDFKFINISLNTAWHAFYDAQQTLEKIKTKPTNKKK